MCLLIYSNLFDYFKIMIWMCGMVFWMDGFIYLFFVVLFGMVCWMVILWVGFSSITN